MFAFRNTAIRTFSNAIRDLYDVLGIKSTASQEEIKTAYYVMSKRYHPDTNQLPTAPKRFHEITQAYEILSNPNSRRQYDTGQLCTVSIPEDSTTAKKMEQTFRDRSGTIIKSSPTEADFLRWTRFSHEQQRSADFEAKQHIEKKRRIKTHDKHALGVELIVISMLITAVVLMLYHPDIDRKKSKK